MEVCPLNFLQVLWQRLNTWDCKKDVCQPFLKASYDRNHPHPDFWITSFSKIFKNVGTREKKSTLKKYWWPNWWLYDRLGQHMNVIHYVSITYHLAYNFQYCGHVDLFSCGTVILILRVGLSPLLLLLLFVWSIQFFNPTWSRIRS